MLGFLMGMRHALDADHLAAVATLATRSRGMGGTVLRGAVWGFGHSLTLLVVGGVCLVLNASVPDHIGRLLELGVGLMLLGLGVEVLWRLRRHRVHVHAHRHHDGVVHLHAHSHAPDEAHDPGDHAHPHPQGFPRRALLVGMVHGLAGSAALVLLVLQSVGSLWVGLAYLGLFGAGSILGMAVLSMVIALPLQVSARVLTGANTALQMCIGVLTIGIGVWVIYSGH
jgi:ABC-type nickel/cobalt efflux system permease component RcnA